MFFNVHFSKVDILVKSEGLSSREIMHKHWSPGSSPEPSPENPDDKVEMDEPYTPDSNDLSKSSTLYNSFFIVGLYFWPRKTGF